MLNTAYKRKNSDNTADFTEDHVKAIFGSPNDQLLGTTPESHGVPTTTAPFGHSEESNFEPAQSKVPVNPAVDPAPQCLSTSPSSTSRTYLLRGTAAINLHSAGRPNAASPLVQSGSTYSRVSLDLNGIGGTVDSSKPEKNNKLLQGFKKSKVGKTYVSNMPHCNNFLRYVVVFGVFFIISELFFARNIANGLMDVLMSTGNFITPSQEKPFEDKLTSSIQLGIFTLFGLICIVGCLFDLIIFLLQKCCCPEDSLAALESRFAALESRLGGDENSNADFQTRPEYERLIAEELLSEPHDLRGSRVNPHSHFQPSDTPGREGCSNDKQLDQPAQTLTL